MTEGQAASPDRARRAAVLGSPIAHSLSPALHRAAYRELGLAGWTYDAIECDEEGLPALLDSLGPDWAGLSLTMPLKRAVLPLLDETEPLAAEVGAANTVILAGGQRRGFNTDVSGIVTALRQAGVTSTDGNVLVIGSGATACSALAALRETGADEVTVAARSLARAAPVLAVGGPRRHQGRHHGPGRRPAAPGLAAADLDDPGGRCRHHRRAPRQRARHGRSCSGCQLRPVADRAGGGGRENRINCYIRL